VNPFLKSLKSLDGIGPLGDQLRIITWCLNAQSAYVFQGMFFETGKSLTSVCNHTACQLGYSAQSYRSWHTKIVIEMNNNLLTVGIVLAFTILFDQLEFSNIWWSGGIFALGSSHVNTVE
jgi:hypothetical protein